MSLGDHLRYLRAMKGGPSLDDVAEAIGWEKLGDISQAEKRYRPVYDNDLIEKLAGYYGRPADEFHWHNARPRKFLTFAAAQAMKTKEPLSLTLRSGEVLTGTIEWWDLGSLGLRLADGRLLCVQRHAVVDWPDAINWEDL
ncbi:MAG: hypothetical protein ACE5FD_04345 [Anaerolineae bacterium]